MVAGEERLPSRPWSRGGTLSLVGESGSGKTVTALSILQLLPYPPASHPAGSIRFKGTEIVGAPEGDAARASAATASAWCSRNP